MNIQWMKIRASVTLLGMSLIATTAVSAQQQWTSQGTLGQSGQQTYNQPADQYYGQQRQHTQQQFSQTRPGQSLQPLGQQQAGVSQQGNTTLSAGQNGVVQGTVPMANPTPLKIYLIRNSKVAYQVTTDQQGNFQLQNVQDGNYSFVAISPTGFVAYGVNVQNNGASGELNLMQPAVVSPRIAGIQQVLTENLPPQIVQDILKITSSPSQTPALNRVRLVRGQLNGQINSITNPSDALNGTMVNLIQNGKRVADVQVDERGYYSIPDVEPGAYDFIAVGNQGLAAIRIEAVDQDTPISQIAYRRTPRLVDTSFDVCLTEAYDPMYGGQEFGMDYATQGQPMFESYAPIEYAGESIGTGSAYGGATNGSFYSGGGGNYGYGGGGRFRGRFGSGGGGLGRLLGIGALTAGIVGLSTDDPGVQSPNN